MFLRVNKSEEDSEASTASTVEDSSEEEDNEEGPRFCRSCGYGPLEAEDAFCPKCGAEQKRQRPPPKSCCRRFCCCCCCCCLCTAALLAALLLALAMTMNVWVKAGLEEVGMAVFGTNVSIGELDLGLQRGYAEIADVVVYSPPGFEGSVFKLGRFVFDLNIATVATAWMSSFVAPVELRQLSVQNIEVRLDVNWTAEESGTAEAECNAEEIVDHMNKVVEPMPTLSPDLARDIGIRAMTARVRVGKVELSNISATVRVAPFLSEEVGYELKKVLVQGVGEESPDGVPLWEFIEILARAILMAVVKEAPAQIRATLAKVFGEKLARGMRAAKEIMYDAGEGLVDLSEFSGWVAGEASLLPLKWGLLQAKLTGKAIAANAALGLKAAEAGAKLTALGARANLAATGAAAKANLKATEAGAKLTGMGIKANMAATKAATKANLAATKVGAKANLEATKVATKANLAATKVATKASLAATKANVATAGHVAKANLEATKLATKANVAATETAAKVNLGAAKMAAKASLAATKARLAAAHAAMELRTHLLPKPLPPPLPPPPPPPPPLLLPPPPPPPPGIAAAQAAAKMRSAFSKLSLLR